MPVSADDAPSNAMPDALLEASERIDVALACLVPDSEEARLIVRSGGECLTANAEGKKLALSLLRHAADPHSPYREWLRSASADALSLHIPVKDADVAYTVRKITLPPALGDDLILLVLSRPNLSSHLIQALSQSRALYKDIADTVPGLIWEIGADGRFSFVHGFSLSGIADAQLIDETPAQALGIPEDVAAEIFLSSTRVESIDLWTTNAEGTPACLSISAKPVFDKDDRWVGSRGIALDVTVDRNDDQDIEDASLKLKDVAESDVLTGLLNRRGFETHLRKICRQLRSADSGGFLALIDLDLFKQLNDRHGHPTGDAALAALGKMLEARTRSFDLCARLGGDEFVLWLDGTTREHVERVCTDLQEGMPALCDGLDLPGFGLTLSIGITALRPGHDDVEQLLARADAALYWVKGAGKAHHIFHEDGPAETRT